MPIPSPKPDEKQAKFISRCMSNDTMKKEYPDQKQRTAICFGQWDKKKGENMDIEKNIKRDEQGRIIVAENVPIVFTGIIEED